MIALANPIPPTEDEDPPCWSHLLEDIRGDIVDRNDIELLVRNFYRDAAMDDLLGPVFEAAHVKWNVHVATLIDFWAWQLLGEPAMTGNHCGRMSLYINGHRCHTRTTNDWVELVCDTVDVSFQGPRAEIAKGRGRKMAAAMERLLAGVSADGTEPVEPMWRRVDAV